MITCFERASWIAQVFLQELEKVSWEYGTLLLAASIEHLSQQPPTKPVDRPCAYWKKAPSTPPVSICLSGWKAHHSISSLSE